MSYDLDNALTALRDAVRGLSRAYPIVLGGVDGVDTSPYAVASMAAKQAATFADAFALVGGLDGERDITADSALHAWLTSPNTICLRCKYQWEPCDIHQGEPDLPCVEKNDAPTTCPYPQRLAFACTGPTGEPCDLWPCPEDKGVELEAPGDPDDLYDSLALAARRDAIALAGGCPEECPSCGSESLESDDGKHGPWRCTGCDWTE